MNEQGGTPTIIFYTNYNELRKRAPLYARKRVLEILEKTGSISNTARLCATTRSTVRRIKQRYEREGERGLVDRSRRPHHSPRRTPLWLEGIIIAEAKKTGYGRDRISRILTHKGYAVKPSTVRYVLKRYKISPKYKRTRYRRRQRYYDFDSLFPLQHFEVDLKEIFDKRTLPLSSIEHARKRQIPPYQWTAIDVKTRLRFLSYSYEKSFANGLSFMLSILYFLRSMGIDWNITFQTDNGEEFGGKSIAKLEYLNREIFKPLRSILIHIPKGKKEYQAFVERSHQTDDNEFYIPQIALCKSKEEFLWRAQRWIWYYNTKREHSVIKTTPFKKLKKHLPWITEWIALFPVIELDKISSSYYLFFKPLPHKSPGSNVLTKDQ